MRRYARVSAAVGGLAARLAGARYLGLGLDRAKHAGDLRQALGGLKGPLMKVAQLMATIPDALPREYAAELAELQADAPSMGWPFVRRRMTAELGAEWEKKFARFDRVAAHAASLGQVHRAWLADGTELACKLQYPDMASAVEADLAQLKLIFRVYERYDPAISTGQIHAEISARLREELDYVREAKHVRLYAGMLKDETGVHLPRLIDRLCTKRLIVMTWLDGVPLLKAGDLSPAKRNRVAMNLFHAWYVPFYFYGTIHGDPHLGNYTIRPDQSVNLLDFGCIRIFKPSFVKGVIDLYEALRDGNAAQAVGAYESWGFTRLDKRVIEVLNLWARFVYAPLLDDRARRIQDAETGQYGREVAEKVHEELRRLGGVKPPREFVFMDRAAIGLGSVFMRLKAEINWHRLFRELIEGFDVDALARRQAKALKAQGLSPAE